MKVHKQRDSQGNIFYKNEKGQYHREDGPAIKWADGDKEWWLNDEHLTEAEVKRRTTRLYKLLYA